MYPSSRGPAAGRRLALVFRNIRKYKTSIIFSVLSAITIVNLLNPNCHARSSYEYIKSEDMWKELYAKTVSNLTSIGLPECKYNVVLHSTSRPGTEGELPAGHRVHDGGEYAPLDCKPRFSTAIIVPYRDRAEHLHSFLIYMHTFLRHQNIHYRIYVVEQIDSKEFNRAKLMNIGARAAMKAGYPCLIFHDVDLYPMQIANIYACTKQPRHMSSSINKFRYLLPYLTLFGGVTALTLEQFKLVNGMSNIYFGWGGEDDDLYVRLEAHGLTFKRFDPLISRYNMMPHRDEPKGAKRRDLLAYAKDRMRTDGLNSLKFTEISTVLHPLFTHIMVVL